MKWFHHECAARHDPKLQMLGASFGAEGIGIYWGLLEEIGQHSDTFHLIITGIDGTSPRLLAGGLEGADKIPNLPLKILARNLFTSPKKLKTVIEQCVEIGLFDQDKWLHFNVLYSPSFEHRADDYTRRLQRKLVVNPPDNRKGSETVRTNTEQCSDKLRIVSVEAPSIVQPKSDNILLETDTEAEEKENKNRTEKKMLLKNTFGVDNSLSAVPASVLRDQTYLIDVSDDDFDDYCIAFHAALQKWNRENSNKIDWSPTVGELRKLFCDGEYERKVTMCYHAFKLLGEKINYPELVMRALKLMLKTSLKTRIVNPFGWIWSCLHGNGNGTAPWVQLITAEEENSMNCISLRQ